jgi:hypothetical protein
LQHTHGPIEVGSSAKQKAEGLFPVGQVHQQVARLLCDPAPIRVARARHELDPTTLDRAMYLRMQVGHIGARR